MDVLPPVHAQLPACEVVRDQPGDEPPLQQRAADPESITGIALHIHMRLDHTNSQWHCAANNCSLKTLIEIDWTTVRSLQHCILHRL